METQICEGVLPANESAIRQDENELGKKQERTESEYRAELFKELDARARQIDKIWSEIWMEMADICLAIDTNELWREGGYHSYNDWLIKACPRSRSWAYMATGARKELRDIADDDLRQIPLASADVLKKLPRKTRCNPDLLEDAKTLTPSEFFPKAIKSAPDSLLEHRVKRYRVYTVSQLNKIDEGMNLWRRLNPGSPLSDADIEEYQWAEYINEHQDEKPE